VGYNLIGSGQLQSKKSARSAAW